MLTPVAPLPENFRRHPTPPRAPHIHAAACRLQPLLDATLPAVYRLSDVAEALGAPAVPLDDLTSALAYLGHPTQRTLEGLLVTLLPPRLIQARDDLVALKFPPGQTLTVRELRRLCQAGWVSTWGVRGSVDRLTTRGVLVACPAPVGQAPYRWSLPPASDTMPVTDR